MVSDTDGELSKKNGFRVFKKSSSNGKITTYLCKRDFIGYEDRADPIEGFIILDPEEFKDKQVFCHVFASFRYGREALDVLGLTFRKYLFFSTVQVYPPIQNPEAKDMYVNGIPVCFNTANCNKEKENFDQIGYQPPNDEQTEICYRQMTPFQEKIYKKIGPNAYPFYFVLPPESPASITLHSGMNEEGKPCGIEYELRTYLYDENEIKKIKTSFVRLAIRKFNYFPLHQTIPQSHAVITKDFLMSAGSLKLEMSLDKGKYYHGESIIVNVTIDNNSMKSVKKIKLSVVQVADIMLFNRAFYRCQIESHDLTENLPIMPGQTGWCQEYVLLPSLNSVNQEKSGLALDGKLKSEETNLASSTLLHNDNATSESLGIIISYRVNIKLIFGFTSRPVQLEIPFILCHPSQGHDLSLPLPILKYSAEANKSEVVEEISNTSCIVHNENDDHVENTICYEDETKGLTRNDSQDSLLSSAVTHQRPAIIS